MASAAAKHYTRQVDFSLLESVPDAMVIVDTEDGRIVHLNGVAERLFGWSRAEAVGQPVEILVPIRFRGTHAADRKAYSASPHVRPMALGRDLSGMRREGKQFPAEISLAPLHAEGKVFVIAAVRDVTERKTIERRAQLYEKARDEIRLRDDFLSIASHEFKTPLATLSLQTQMLLRALERSGDKPFSMQRPRVEAVHRQTRHLSRLVQGLLDITQITAGRLVLRPETVDLAAIVRDAAAKWRETLARAKSELHLRVGENITGRWDPMRLEQIIDNLVGNAVKYGAGKPVEVVAESDGAMAHIVVRDEGIGIAPEDQQRIFERFERAVSKRSYGGFGLGLWIVRKIVEAHRGEIRVSSEVGRGSRFEVMLPRNADA
jgi:PAS domain S-box-containing protein